MKKKLRRVRPYWSRVIERVIAGRESLIVEDAMTAPTNNIIAAAPGDFPDCSFIEEERIAASRWTTCACGKQDSRIPRYEGAPKDKVLCRLGAAFYDAVHEQDPYRALYLLGRIERRAAEILARVTARRRGR